MPENTPTDWMIYGANGYTGILISRQAKALGLTPTLAGRNKKEVEALGRELGLNTEIFDLENKPEEFLKKYQLVLNCAGPFSKTYAPLIDACLKSRTHYLDITGEIDVFEGLFSLQSEAKKAGIIVIPGVGFDVVPTDCLAKKLSEELPHSSEITLVLNYGGSLSPGTMKTAVESLHYGTRERKNGVIVSDHQLRIKKMGFRDDWGYWLSIPWGDVSTTYYSTGIKNISVYVKSSKSIRRMRIFFPFFRFLLKLKWIQSILKFLIQISISGPKELERNKGKVIIWGKIKNSKGKEKTMGIQMEDPYDFTVHAALKVVQRLLNSQTNPGVFTPSTAFGHEFINEFDSIKWL